MDETLKRLEREEMEAGYREEMRKRREWEMEVERIRVEVATQLQHKYDQKVGELELAFERRQEALRRESSSEHNPLGSQSQRSSEPQALD